MKIEENRYSDIFLRLKEKQSEVRTSSAKDRIKKLQKLKEAVSITHKQRIRDALYADFKKPQLEVDFTEILPCVEEIDYVIKRLPFWLRRQKVSTPISLFGSSSYIKYESKGVCLIISPWNFPVNLTLIPLVSAVAAGNSVVLKPSEFTPHTSALMEEIIKEVFDENEVVLIRGEVETSKELLKLPFNHIFFTGSPTVGKKVMEAASKHLTSVTLELGGKSPCIIDKDVNVKKTVNKIAFGKFMNAGQTCIAPDYVFVHESVREEVMDELKKTISEFYPQIKEGSSYVELVNEKHYERIKGFIDDAKGKNASVYQQETFSSEGNFIGPTLISNVNEDMEIMKEEIFGPILPIKSFKEKEEVMKYINANEKPLALYIFSNNKNFVEDVINNTSAGTTCINHNLLQFLNPHLPFGGSNNSGIGKSHGIYGFKEFANARAVLEQHTISPADLLTPPYTSFKQKLIDFTLKWL